MFRRGPEMREELSRGSMNGWWQHCFSRAPSHSFLSVAPSSFGGWGEREGIHGYAPAYPRDATTQVKSGKLSELKPPFSIHQVSEVSGYSNPSPLFPSYLFSLLVLPAPHWLSPGEARTLARPLVRPGNSGWLPGRTCDTVKGIDNGGEDSITWVFS